MLLAQDCLLGGVGRSLHCGPHRQVSQELASYLPSFSGLPSLCSSSENLV